MQKIILIHGIGNNNPGWSDKLNAHRILGIEADQIIEFNYEDLMENHWVNKILVATARIAASYYATPAAGFAANHVQDYLDDILTYFVVPGVRKKVIQRLAGVLYENPDAIIIGFSLGSVVAYETIKNFPGVGRGSLLITVGSPLGSPPLKGLVRRFLKVSDFKRPDVSDWFNFYSTLDPISGRITKLGCRRADQFKVKSLHLMDTYLEHIKTLIPEKFTGAA